MPSMALLHRMNSKTICSPLKCIIRQNSHLRCCSTFSWWDPNLKYSKKVQSNSGILHHHKGERKVYCKVFCVLDAGASSERNDETAKKSSTSELGGTRLGRLVRASANQLLGKLNGARSNFPSKTFLLLLGYYTANALATIIGQTGDWDVLVAGIAVAAIEGIGILMYRTPIGRGRLQSLVTMLNFWKAGVCLGLFVDAFKLGS